MLFRSVNSVLADGDARGWEETLRAKETILGTEDKDEGVRAFFEKRPPAFPLKPSKDMPPFGPWKE